jgi:hypothetical protein
MNQTILPQFAIILYGGRTPLTRFEVELFFLIFGIGILVAICWGAVEDLIERTRGRNWPTASAIIDIVSVVSCVSGKSIYYIATLTYAYHNPELQMGDYSRTFGDKDEAEAWANSYKGETVKIHIDPRDPTRSVLRKEDL